MTDAVSFRTVVSAFGNNTGIEVPPEVVERLGAGKRPAVVVSLGDHTFQTTLGVMGGASLVSVSAAVRKATGLAAGDEAEVTLSLATEPRAVVLHEDFRAALDAQPKAAQLFASLSNSLQRYHADLVNDAKTAETRSRRIAKAVDLFLAGKKR